VTSRLSPLANDSSPSAEAPTTRRRRRASRSASEARFRAIQEANALFRTMRRGTAPASQEEKLATKEIFRSLKQVSQEVTMKAPRASAPSAVRSTASSSQQSPYPGQSGKKPECRWRADSEQVRSQRRLLAEFSTCCRRRPAVAGYPLHCLKPDMTSRVQRVLKAERQYISTPRSCADPGLLPIWKPSIEHACSIQSRPNPAITRC